MIEKKHAVAEARSNIALVKYWGKRDKALNLPAVGSISITLDQLSTKTEVAFKSELQHDLLFLNGHKAEEKENLRVSRFLDLIREKAQLDHRAEIKSENNFPTAAGLASSASAFAALALAASRAAGLPLDKDQLSILARRGSGSAARSIYGGFAEMKITDQTDGSGDFAAPLAPKNHWDLRILIAVTSEEKKKTGSTDGMTLSRDTSPYYDPWVESSSADIDEMRRAVLARDFEKVAEISEFSCLKMHALALASNPGLLYWNGITVEAIHTIRSLREQGTAVFFTIDAGPQIKAVCLPSEVKKVKNALQSLPGLKRIIETGLGDGARLVGVDE